MRGGQPYDFDFDPEEDPQSMSKFEKDREKEWLETMMADKLAPYEGRCAESRETRSQEAVKSRIIE